MVQYVLQTSFFFEKAVVACAAGFAALWGLRAYTNNDTEVSEKVVEKIYALENPNENSSAKEIVSKLWREQDPVKHGGAKDSSSKTVSKAVIGAATDAEAKAHKKANWISKRNPYAVGGAIIAVALFAGVLIWKSMTMNRGEAFSAPQHFHGDLEFQKKQQYQQTRRGGRTTGRGPGNNRR